jgi:hypothetical protein
MAGRSAFAQSAAAVTEIYKCADAGGRPLYTSDKKDTAGKKCELVSREINVVPSQKPSPSPTARRSVGAGGTFPRESPDARASAKDRQRDILERELATEQSLLAEAKKALAAQEAVRTGDERNYARVEERLKPYQEKVDLHEKNVQALQRELGNVFK